MTQPPTSDVGWIDKLPARVRAPVVAFADPHPPGARARAQLAAQALVDLAAGWSAGGPALEPALRELADHLNAVGQTTLHQPGVRNMIDAVLGAGLGGSSTEVAARMAATYERVSATMADASAVMARAGADLLTNGDRVLVHDFADRSTQAVIRQAAVDGKHLTVVATACRSRRTDGIRVARESLEVGHDVIVVTDAGTAWAVTSLGLRLAFIGADAVLRDGSVLTTPGALAIALAGREAGVPVYAVTDLWKVMAEVSPALRALNEVEDPDGVPEALEWRAAGYGFRNPLVDVIPGTVLRGLITEAGFIRPADAGHIARERYGLGGGDAAA